MNLEYVIGTTDPSSRLWETLPTRRPTEKRDSFYEEEPINVMESRYIRVIPQGTVDNNLGPDRLAGPKALDPNYCRQPTL